MYSVKTCSSKLKIYSYDVKLIILYTNQLILSLCGKVIFCIWLIHEMIIVHLGRNLGYKVKERDGGRRMEKNIRWREIFYYLLAMENGRRRKVFDQRLVSFFAFLLSVLFALVLTDLHCIAKQKGQDHSLGFLLFDNTKELHNFLEYWDTVLWSEYKE